MSGSMAADVLKTVAKDRALCAAAPGVCDKLEEAAETDSVASLSTPTTVPDSDKVASGRVEKPKIQQWATSSEKTKRRNRRNRDRYQAKKRDEKSKREQTRKSNREEDDESDEWDPWHQANGPDVQKDDTVDLDY